MNNLTLRFSLVSGLFATVLLIFLAGDIWVWRGALLEQLTAWVAEEGGEQAFWGAAVLYSTLILLAFLITIFQARWFRRLTFVLIVLMLLSTISKLIGGFNEYYQVGWYFFLLFSVQTFIAIGLALLSYQWLRSE